jgi:8-oxo-dGTP pyrophosphatase MutT (NUDIX family)
MPVLDLIRTYRPIHADDDRIRTRFIAFVTRYPDCLERSLAIGHITASAWVIDPTGKRVAMVHHRKLARWLQPGGHADGCSEIESVARREVEEETGLADLVLVGPVPFDLDIHPIPEYRGVRAHEHFDVRFAFQTSGSLSLQLSDESHDVAWIPIDRLEACDPDASILRMRDKWMNMKRNG